MITFKKTAIISFSVLIFIIIFFAVNERVMPWNKKEAISLALSWGGLPPLPENSKHVKVLKKGNMFTRQFIIELHADPIILEDWINSSKLKTLKPVINSESLLKYEIKPGENGAIGGFVTINKKLNKIIIDMSWS